MHHYLERYKLAEDRAIVAAKLSLSKAYGGQYDCSKVTSICGNFSLQAFEEKE